MKSDKVIRISIGLFLVIELVLSIISKSSNNRFFLPIALICLSIVGVLNGILEYRKKNYIFAVFFIVASIAGLLIILSGIKYMLLL